MMHPAIPFTRSANRDEPRARIRAVLVAHDAPSEVETRAERARRVDALGDTIADAISSEATS